MTDVDLVQTIMKRNVDKLLKDSDTFKVESIDNAPMYKITNKKNGKSVEVPLCSMTSAMVVLNQLF